MRSLRRLVWLLLTAALCVLAGYQVAGACTATTPNPIYNAAGKQSPPTTVVTLRTGAGAVHLDRAMGTSSRLTTVFVAAETADEIPGLSSAYKDVTTGNSIRNVATDVTPQQFGDNLSAEGWKVTTSTSGRGATIYTKDGATYSVYGQSASTGGPTAQFIPRGATSPTLKIRLGN